MHAAVIIGLNLTASSTKSSVSAVGRHARDVGGGRLTVVGQGIADREGAAAVIGCIWFIVGSGEGAHVGLAGGGFGEGVADFIECERAVGPREFRRDPEGRLTDVRLGLGQDAAGLGDSVALSAGAG